MARTKLQRRYDRLYKKNYLNLINNARDIAGYTYEYIGESIGVSHQAIGNVFIGKNRSPRTIQDICKVLGIDFRSLLNL